MHEVKVSDDGARGIFKKNGKIAMEHQADLAALVCELVMKETWEVVSEKRLREGGGHSAAEFSP